MYAVTVHLSVLHQRSALVLQRTVLLWLSTLVATTTAAMNKKKSDNTLLRLVTLLHVN
jgi:hypothetical protein